MNPFKDILNDGKTLPAAGRCSVGKFVSPRDQTTQFTFLSVDTKDVENESPSREKIRRQSVGKVNRSPMQKRKSSGSSMAGIKSNWDLEDDKPHFMRGKPPLEQAKPKKKKTKESTESLMRRPFNSPKPRN